MELLSLAEQGKLKPHIDNVVALEEAKEAFRALANRYVSSFRQAWLTSLDQQKEKL